MQSCNHCCCRHGHNCYMSVSDVALAAVAALDAFAASESSCRNKPFTRQASHSHCRRARSWRRASRMCVGCRSCLLSIPPIHIYLFTPPNHRTSHPTPSKLYCILLPSTLVYSIPPYAAPPHPTPARLQATAMSSLLLSNMAMVWLNTQIINSVLFSTGGVPKETSRQCLGYI